MKIQNFLKTVFIFLPFLFCGCAAGPSAPPNPIWDVWHIPKAPTVLRVSFTPDGRVVGVMGLNNFFAPVRYLPNGGLEIHSIAISRRGEYPDFADRFFKALRSARYGGVANGKLHLFDGAKKKVMVLEQLKP